MSVRGVIDFDDPEDIYVPYKPPKGKTASVYQTIDPEEINAIAGDPEDALREGEWGRNNDPPRVQRPIGIDLEDFINLDDMGTKRLEESEMRSSVVGETEPTKYYVSNMKQKSKLPLLNLNSEYSAPVNGGTAPKVSIPIRYKKGNEEEIVGTQLYDYQERNNTGNKLEKIRISRTMPVLSEQMRDTNSIGIPPIVNTPIRLKREIEIENKAEDLLEIQDSNRVIIKNDSRKNPIPIDDSINDYVNIIDIQSGMKRSSSTKNRRNRQPDTANRENNIHNIDDRLPKGEAKIPKYKTNRVDEEVIMEIVDFGDTNRNNNEIHIRRKKVDKREEIDTDIRDINLLEDKEEKREKINKERKIVKKGIEYKNEKLLDIVDVKNGYDVNKRVNVNFIPIDANTVEEVYTCDNLNCNRIHKRLIERNTGKILNSEHTSNIEIEQINREKKRGNIREKKILNSEHVGGIEMEEMNREKNIRGNIREKKNNVTNISETMENGRIDTLIDRFGVGGVKNRNENPKNMQKEIEKKSGDTILTHDSKVGDLKMAKPKRTERRMPRSAASEISAEEPKDTPNIPSGRKAVLDIEKDSNTAVDSEVKLSVSEKNLIKPKLIVEFNASDVLDENEDAPKNVITRKLLKHNPEFTPETIDNDDTQRIEGSRRARRRNKMAAGNMVIPADTLQPENGGVTVNRKPEIERQRPLNRAAGYDARTISVDTKDKTKTPTHPKPIVNVGEIKTDKDLVAVTTEKQSRGIRPRRKAIDNS